MGTDVRLRTRTATHPSHRHASQSAHARQYGRLHQILIQNVPPARAQRFADADLVSPFGDHREHNVHDHDAANNHEDRDDAHRHAGDGRRQALPEAHDGVRREQAEIVVLPRPQMAVGTEQHTHFVLRLHEMRLVDGLGEQADAGVAAVGLEIALDRDHHEVILRIAKHAAQRLGDADHLVRHAFHRDGLAYGIGSREKARADVVADEHYRRVAANLLVGDGAAAIDLNVVDLRNAVGDPLNVDSLLGFALVGNARLAGDHHSEIFQHGGVALHELILVRPELGIALLHFEELLGVEVAEESHADHAEAVRPHVGDFFGDIDVHAVDQRGDGDQRRSGEDDAQEREEAAEFVLSKRVEGDACGLPEGGAEAELRGFGHDWVCLRDARWGRFVPLPNYWDGKGGRKLTGGFLPT